MRIIKPKRYLKRWTEQEKVYLKENYLAEDKEVIMANIDRTWRAIRCQANSMGLERATNKKTHEKFKKEFYDIFDEDEYILLSAYKGNHEYVAYYHTLCGRVNKSTPASLLGGHGCICLKANSNRVTKEEFIRRIEEQGKGEYEVSDKAKYKDTTTPVILRHKVCGREYATKPNNFFNGRRCPFCYFKGLSKGENLVRDVLISKGVEFLEEATLPNLKYIRQLYYDFLLDEEDIIIEYQGEQHYSPIDYLGGFEKFKSQIIRDQIKLEFAEMDGYKLIEVPYTLDTYEDVNEFLSKEILA